MLPNVNTILLIGISLLLGTTVAGLVKSNNGAMVMVPKTCTMERVIKLLGYGCSRLDLTEIPMYLKTSVEVINL